jgi:ribosomal-protein-alanine N-acetyltransferase
MNGIKFTPFPILKTERLELRRLSDNDKDTIFLLRSNESIKKYIDRPLINTIEEAIEFITRINNGIQEDKLIYWAISFKENPELIGTICLWNFSSENQSAELGYELRPNFQGQGFMTEAINCVIQYAFKNIAIKTLEAYTHKDNLNSVRLLEKNGFRLESHKIYEENLSFIIYSLTNKQVR